MKKIRMGVVSIAALGAAAFALPAGGAQALSGTPQTASAAVQSADDVTSAARCSGVRKITVTGGYLKYKECKKPGKRKVIGVSLNDTKNNSRCVYADIKFVPSGLKKHYRDCGGDVTKFDTGWHKARDAQVRVS
ncbi:hypothetical protein [Streptomyces sp. NPDC059009]|uniref:hypothetical protein n=1 Tax=Streptomyces sp. NPDC059009 TaxID=3346694 RepID=UPI00367CA151